jgi:hypothetical protein
MALPPELEQKLDQQVTEYEEAQKMSYMTSIERIGYQRGIEAGFQEGELQNAREAVLEILQLRFGELSLLLIKRLKSLHNLPLLKQFLKRTITIPSVADFEAELYCARS